MNFYFRNWFGNRDNFIQAQPATEQEMSEIIAADVPDPRQDHHEPLQDTLQTDESANSIP